MHRFGLLYAVAALAATALFCLPQNPAFAYCRGCVVEMQKADLATTAHAEALPVTIKASCHIEKQKRVSNGRTRWRRVEICE